MKKITFLLLLLFACTYSFSQTSIVGFVYDKTTNESLPYATITILSNKNYYTITNEDGKFEINNKFALDSMEVRFIGYKAKKIAISYFKEKTKLFLAQEVFKLNSVNVLAKKDKDYAYKLLSRLIKKYRKQDKIIKSKGFLTLNTSTKGVPLEIIEGFYNSEQSLSKGIIDLKIKSGRFGQNKSFPFYSLNSTDILKNFQFFKSSHQILPLHPGNLALSTLKNKYTVKIEQCKTCKSGDLSIYFIPKKLNGRLFFGKIIFNKETLSIKNIELGINDPKTNELSSIITNHEITPKKITLNINFNPNNYNQIQTIDYNFTMYYKSKESIELINTNAFIYFYEYNNPFDEPYFTKEIKFNNDYDKIIALQATNEFWDSNYQFPKSFKSQKSIDFLKEYGNLINYENVIPSNDMEITKPSVISWDQNNRLKWENIKEETVESKKANNYENRTLTKDVKADNVYHSNSDFVKTSPYFSNNYKSFVFCYILDRFKNSNGKDDFITRTVFDRNASSYKNTRSKNMLIYLNLSFDIYEYYRQKLELDINDEMTFEEVKKLTSKRIKDATLTVEKMKKETNSGLNFQKLMRWNKSIKSKLNVDNYILISKQI